jgi:3-oxoacyl-[acyl-carrier protein] reductase
MMARGFGRIVNITSSTVKAPIRSLDLSSGARSGLTGFIASVAREAVTRNVTVNNLLPGAFATDRLTSTLAQSAQAQGQTAESKMAEWVNKIPAGRFGDPAEFGALCAFVCSAQAGYLTGQNILIDGGAYPGVF